MQSYKPVYPQSRHLKVALFSGNYNYTKDGSNQALNKLTGFLENCGAQVKVFSPVVKNPAFAPTGTLIGVPSIAIPGRPEYRLACGLTGPLKDLLNDYQPNLIHLSAPDVLGFSAQKYARKNNIPCVASVHTRFETYPKYYGMPWLEGPMVYLLRRFYNRCNQVYAPSTSMANVMQASGLGKDVRIWGRGIDREKFTPQFRNLEWRRSLGIADNEVVVLFVSRLVKEKGLELIAETIKTLEGNTKFRFVAVGDGPAKDMFSQLLPNAIFTGFLTGEALSTAYASSDIFFFPSTTETFGNVTLEGMSSGLPVVVANATGSSSIVKHGITGYLDNPLNDNAFVESIRNLIIDPIQRKTMSMNARHATLDYTWDSVMQNLLRNYTDLLQQKV